MENMVSEFVERVMGVVEGERKNVFGLEGESYLDGLVKLKKEIEREFEMYMSGGLMEGEEMENWRKEFRG